MSDVALERAAIAFRPEDDPIFRMSQMLLLLDELQPGSTTLDRLTYYDFFAESPYLLFSEDGPARSILRVAGFESSALSYFSPAQRFVTRQERVSGDLAALISYGLADANLNNRVLNYSVTTAGSDLSRRFRAMYADAYRTSAWLVIEQLKKLPNKRLHEKARDLMSTDSDRFWAVEPIFQESR